MFGYAEEVEVKMQRLYNRLSEKDRRRYAGIEALKLGHGGAAYIGRLFAIDPKTVHRGIEELELIEELEPARVRKKRRGAKNPHPKNADT